MTISLEELIQYWQGELEPDREAIVEEVLFDDVETARRLDAIARLDAAVRALVARGRWQSTFTVEGVESLRHAGLSIRTYEVDRGETVSCTVASEDFVVIRLQGDFAGAERVDVVMDGTLEGMPPASERYDDVAVDQRTGEVVFLYPGDRIRALPRSRFEYRVRSGERDLGSFGLDHTPP